MPLMGFEEKKYLDRGVGGWVELYPNYFWIFGIFSTLQSPKLHGYLIAHVKIANRTQLLNFS